MPRGNPDNLINNADLTPEQIKINTSKAGKASGKARAEKKRMSQIYAEFLDKDHDIIGKDGIKKKLSGHALLSSVMSKVLARGDSAAVSLMKEIREATEGSNYTHNLTIDNDFKIVKK